MPAVPPRSAPIDDTGSATLEIAILAPGLLLLLGLLIGVGRTQHAHQAVESAARDAARQASISRSPGTATRTATGIAEAALAREGLRCAPVVTVAVAGTEPAGRRRRDRERHRHLRVAAHAAAAWLARQHRDPFHLCVPD